MEDLTRRHAMWVARSVSRTDRSPLTGNDIMLLEEACTARRVPAGTVIEQAGSVDNDVHIVREGRLHLVIKNPGLGRQTTGIVSPGEIVGDVPIFADEPLEADVVADVDSLVLTIRRDGFLRLLATSSSLAIRWMTSLAQRLSSSSQRIESLLTQDLASQIATILLDHRVAEDGVWLVPMPHQTIANLLGARRQSVSRVLGQMRRDGLVRSRYGSVEIVDLHGIATLAGRDTGLDEDDTALAASA